MIRNSEVFFSFIFVSLVAVIEAQSTFYVATDGADSGARDGSVSQPWASIQFAMGQVVAGDTILVRPGTYSGRQQIAGDFAAPGVTIRSEVPYQARLRNNDRVITIYSGSGITVEGFDIAHDGAGASPLVFHVQSVGTERIIIRNNILHDAYNNDILKINNGANDVMVEGCLFYNQGDSDEHIDINSVTDVTVQDCVFFNDYTGSGRPISGGSSSFIVIKDSNAGDDGLIGADDITIRRNIFLNWQGSAGSNFVLIGEDGQPFHEASNVLVENCLMLGNSVETIRAPFGVKGARDITFRSNTLVGDMPSNAFAFRLNKEGGAAQPNNQNINFYNNIWSDPTGTMNDFSDTPPAETDTFTLDNNLYWNGGSAIPENSGGDLVNYTNDTNRTVGNPSLPALTGITLPRWQEGSSQFADGSASIRAVFENLANSYAELPSGSTALDAACADQAPTDDLLGRSRTGGTDLGPDLGAMERQTAIPVTASTFSLL